MKGSSVAVFSYFLDGLVQYFVEPVARIFGPDDNTYPEIGVQPFEGEPYSKWVES
jgi:hypothetical protein